MAPKKRSRSRKRSRKNSTPSQKHETTETAPQAVTNGRYFEIETMENILRDGFSGTVDRQAAVFLAGVMQYIATEIIEVSGNAAKENVLPGEPFTITPEDILTGIQSDNELKEIFNGDNKSLARKTKKKQ